MQRYQLFEIADQPWLPSFLRDYITDYLQYVVATQRPYDHIVPQLLAGLRGAEAEQIVGLCSGAGGPWPALLDRLADAGPRPALTLTDRYPHRHAVLTVPWLEADARDVPIQGAALRTIFAGFHHFPPEDAQAILRDAARAGQGLLVVEGTERNVTSIAAVLLSTIACLVLTPFIPRRTVGRFLFTYLIPLVPFIVLFDGIVSSLRTYSADEMRALAVAAVPQGYEWTAGRTEVPRSPLAITWLLGVPAQSKGHAMSDGHP